MKTLPPLIYLVIRYAIYNHQPVAASGDLPRAVKLAEEAIALEPDDHHNFAVLAVPLDVLSPLVPHADHMCKMDPGWQEDTVWNVSRHGLTITSKAVTS